MILVCPTCSARYLVPATVFAQGPRPVRCAKCGHVWQAGLPDEPSSGIAPSGAGRREVVAPPSMPSAPAPQTPSKPLPPLTEPPSAPTPVPPGSNLPALRPESSFGWGVWVGVAVLLCLVCGAVVGGIMARQDIARRWPAVEPFYEKIHLPIAHVGDGLSFQNITSERRFEESAMQLFVSGEIRNDSAAPLLLPPVKVVAVGADGLVVQEWLIDAPAPQLDPGASAAFSSMIPAPQQAVAEVNLSFVDVDAHGD